MAFGDEPPKSSSRESLKVLGTVGEPINPEAQGSGITKRLVIKNVPL